MRIRWWIATLFVLYAHRITRRETGEEPVWLQEFAIAHIRAFQGGNNETDLS